MPGPDKKGAHGSTNASQTLHASNKSVMSNRSLKRPEGLLPIRRGLEPLAPNARATGQAGHQQRSQPNRPQLGYQNYTNGPNEVYYNDYVRQLPKMPQTQLGNVNMPHLIDTMAENTGSQRQETGSRLVSGEM